MKIPKYIKKCKCGEDPNLDLDLKWLAQLTYIKIWCPHNEYRGYSNKNHYEPCSKSRDCEEHKSIILEIFSKWNSTN